MQKFLGNIDSNATHASAYKTQAAGFYTGGSLFIRSPNTSSQLINIQAPKIGFDCGGIDLFAGGIGFINSKHLVNNLRNVVSASAAYAFSLGFKQMSPQLMNQLEEMQAWANEANWNNINSCYLGKKIVDSSIGVIEENRLNNCIQKLTEEHGEKYFVARDKCQKKDRRISINQDLANSPEADRALDNMNFTWRAINKNSYFASKHPDFKYLLMSLVGTLIFHSSPDGAVNKKIYPSKLYGDNLLKAIHSGGSVQVYACVDDSKCLNLSDKNISISINDTVFNMVKKTLESIETKIAQDEPLNAAEQEFLNSTSLPVYKMLNVQSAFSKGMSFVFVSTYAEIISLDILYQFINNCVNDVVNTFQAEMLPEKSRREFIEMASSVRLRLQDLRQMQNQKINATMDMIAKLQMMEKQISSTLSADVFNSMNWSRGL